MGGTQFDKGNSFRALHQGPRSFIIAPTPGTPDRRASWRASALRRSPRRAAPLPEKHEGLRRTRPRRDASTCKIEPDTFERKEGNSHVRCNIAEDAGF